MDKPRCLRRALNSRVLKEPRLKKQAGACPTEPFVKAPLERFELEAEPSRFYLSRLAQVNSIPGT